MWHFSCCTTLHKASWQVHLLITCLSYVGAMKNVKIDYVPRWAMYMEETRWLNSVKANAAKVVLKALLLFFQVLPCPADVP